MIKKVRIADRYVGEGYPCLIVAEAGSNHDRKISQAKKLIDVAKESGCDIVKFQTFKADKLYSKKTPDFKYLKKNKLMHKGETTYDLLKRIEIPWRWHKELSDYCKQKKIIFMSTPFDLDAVAVLEKIGVPAYKIASFEIVHLPLLREVAKTKKPIILSTGMADLRDIDIALKTIYKEGNKKVILLHCAINYPPRYEDLNLRAMDTMRRRYRLPIGFSDHTLGITSAICAVSLGADVIEKHFTLSRSLPGPDHPFALEPDELKLMVDVIKQAEKSLGSPLKKHTKAEAQMYRLGRRSIVAASPIPKGTVIKEEMLEIKRPGYGIGPVEMKRLIGKRARVDIDTDDILLWKMVR